MWGIRAWFIFMPSASSSNSGFHSFILLCFGCWVLVLVVFLMTSPSASKTVLLWQTSCVFGGGNIAGSTMRKVPHLAMCGDFALFMGCNIFVALCSSLSFQQSWFHLIRSSFAKVIAVLVWLFWTGLLGPDISFHRNFRFPNSSKKSAKERRKRGAGLNRKLWSDILMTRNFRVALKEPRENG